MNDTTSADAIKPKLLALLRQGQAEIQAWVDDLTEAERAAIGTSDAWAPKDTLTHMAFWQDVSTSRLSAIARGDTPESFEDFQRYNEETFERERLRPWDEVLADARRISESHIAAASALSEDQFNDTLYNTESEGRPLWTSPAGNGFEHPMEHLGNFYRQRGDLPHAAEIVERQAAGMLSLDSSDRSRGAVRYNQGCFWALSGQPDRAIPLLREALTLRPDLVDWSHKDTDLTTLRDLPDFQAIYTSLNA